MKSHEAELAYQLQQRFLTELGNYSRAQIEEVIKTALAEIHCLLIADSTRIAKEMR